MDTLALDDAVGVLQERKDEWAKLPIREKINYLSDMADKSIAVAEEWVAVEVKTKQISPESPWVGEEWISGPWAMLHNLKGLRRTLEALDKGYPPAFARRALRKRPDGQLIVRVFPETNYERLLLNKITGEVWMQPGVTAENLAQNMASFYKEEIPSGMVSLVLAPANISSIAPLDVLYRLYAEGRVCFLKLHPANVTLLPIFEAIFARLIEAGYLRIASGGRAVGEYLTSHSGIEAIHITGNAKTFETIIFGEGKATQHKDLSETGFSKAITAELGGVGPTIIVPGPWSNADIRYQTEHILTQKHHNAGFNCVASQVLVTPGSWNRSGELLDAIRKIGKSIAPRVAYYPGAEARFKRALEAHPKAEFLDAQSTNAVPRILIANLDPEDDDEYCFREEVFGGTLAQTSIRAETASEFLYAAVRFANNRLQGSLGANIIIHPKTIREMGPELEDAISKLHYGNIGINSWTGVNYLLSQNSWGAYPGHRADDIQSGMGVVHNTYLFDKPQKSVTQQPFYPFPRNILYGEMHLTPKPAWFITNRQAHNIGRRFTQFESNPSLLKLPGIFLDALRG